MDLPGSTFSWAVHRLNRVFQQTIYIFFFSVVPMSVSTFGSVHCKRKGKVGLVFRLQISPNLSELGVCSNFFCIYKYIMFFHDSHCLPF